MFFTTPQFVNNALNELSINSFLGFSGFQLANIIFNHQNLLLEKSDLFEPLLSV